MNITGHYRHLFFPFCKASLPRLVHVILFYSSQPYPGPAPPFRTHRNYNNLTKFLSKMATSSWPGLEGKLIQINMNTKARLGPNLRVLTIIIDGQAKLNYRQSLDCLKLPLISTSGYSSPAELNLLPFYYFYKIIYILFKQPVELKLSSYQASTSGYGLAKLNLLPFFFLYSLFISAATLYETRNASQAKPLRQSRWMDNEAMQAIHYKRIDWRWINWFSDTQFIRYGRWTS